MQYNSQIGHFHPSSISRTLYEWAGQPVAHCVPLVGLPIPATRSQKSAFRAKIVNNPAKFVENYLEPLTGKLLSLSWSQILS